MKRLARVFGNWWVVSIAVAVFVALLLALVLPLLIHSLRSSAWMIATLAAVVVAWCAAAAWRVISARRASDRLAKGLLEQSTDGGEAAALAERMSAALDKLKAESGGRRNYLYERPWYVIIGPPAAGKTTALLSSGLRFPFSDASLKGVGGTRNLDFWFADEAVLIDTAGRYTSQDSAEARDREGWSHFLGLLRRNRPLQPINGVMVAIGLDTLMAADTATVDYHADIIRRRLRELREGLGTVAPVYVMFTKADLIAGFGEYFADLDVEGRRAVLGATLPYAEGAPDSRQFALAFDGVAQAVADRSATRLQDEADARRRGLIIGFPAQFYGLRDTLVRFLGGAFPWDAREEAAQVRGFYFTSGVEQGTPFDRLLGGVAQVSDRPTQPRGRAYFLNRLLKEVMFAETGLARPTEAALNRSRTILRAAYASAAVVCGLTLLAWTFSFVAARDYQNKVEAAAGDALKTMTNVDLGQYSESGDAKLADTLPALDALRALPGGYNDRRKSWFAFPGVPMGLGLFDSALSKDVEQAYLHGLQRVMQPRLLARLEQVQSGAQTASPQLYAALRAYRLLGADAPPKAERSELTSVEDWVVSDWSEASLASADLTDVRGGLRVHLHTMLATMAAAKESNLIWAGRRPQTDPGLIRTSQNVLASIKPAQRAYALILSMPSNKAGWTEPLPEGELVAFARPDAVKALSVPYLFTRAGFYHDYQLRLAQAQLKLSEDDWVLGPQAQAQHIPMDELRRDVGILYAGDYIGRWRGVLAALQPADYFGSDAAASALYAEPSPLVTLVKAVGDETNLTSSKIPGGADAAGEITNAFTRVRTADMAGFVAAIKAANQAQRVLRSGHADPVATSESEKATEALRTAAMSLPGDMVPFVSSAAKLGSGSQDQSSAAALQQNYAQNVLPLCEQVTKAQFPFFMAAAVDAQRSDVLGLFGQGGKMDQFVQGGLMDHIETSRAAWAWKAADPVTAGLQSSPERFQEAAQLRDLLSNGLQMTIYALDFSPGVRSVRLSIGGSAISLQPNDSRGYPMAWSAGQNGEASITFGEGGEYVQKTGPWAVFHLFAPPAQIKNAGSNTIKVTVSNGTQWASFKIVLPQGEPNPFRGGPPWDFRCPAAL